LPAAERDELYPGDREDVIDFCLPSHEPRLGKGWYDLEGVFGGKYRWMGASASAHLKRVRPGPQRLRIRGHALDGLFAQGQPVRLEAIANGQKVGQMVLDRSGIFVFETDLPDAEEYALTINASPTWMSPPDDRVFTVTVGMIRLI
ncbi:MAG: hypothetical protein ABIZ80_19145, partial [Bryobacteraceae bacterium]